MVQPKRSIVRSSLARSGMRSKGNGIFQYVALKAVASIFLVVDFVLLLYALLGGSGLLDYAEDSRATSELERELEELEARNRLLSREITLLKTDTTYLEKAVRHRLHYLRANEILYLFGEGTPRTGESHDGKN